MSTGSGLDWPPKLPAWKSCPICLGIRNLATCNKTLCGLDPSVLEHAHKGETATCREGKIQRIGQQASLAGLAACCAVESLLMRPGNLEHIQTDKKHLIDVFCTVRAPVLPTHVPKTIEQTIQKAARREHREQIYLARCALPCLR